MPVPQRSPSGISTQSVGRCLGNYPTPDPTKVLTVFNDFQRYVAGEWTVANTSTGASALAAGSVIVQTTAVGATDYATLANSPAPFNFAATQQVWFNINFQLSNITVPTFLAGLVAGTIAAFTATPPTDGIYFYKAPASTVISLIIKVGGVATTTVIPAAALTGANSKTGVVPFAAATYMKLGFYYNAYNQQGAPSINPTIEVFVNTIPVLSISTLTNLPVATALATAFGIGSGAGAINTCTVDYVIAAQDRT